ncbi:MAG TPA: serine/threonine-protein kinase [Gemmatimonadales bacterium]|nr:serine/threonine-protein kinase [Gemmatimonadales bacterium]
MSDALVSDTIERLRLTLADRYAVDREVGRGGMATVFLAHDLRHDRRVAIKVLRPELSASLGAGRFHREIEIAARLQHPNVLALYDSGDADGLLYYVMPFVEGESLRDRVDREKQLPLEDAIRLIREAADALGYAHAHDIIHRDIKPENILLSDGHALVADFGIARAVTAAGGQKLTETGMAVGTPYYMSPEQGMGTDQVDARSDVYSLGCVLYELLAGQPPFTGPNPMAVLARHSLEAVPSLQIVRQTVPDEVEAIIVKALEKTPADRFRSMQEFSESLRDADYSRVTRRTTARMIPTVELPVTKPPERRRVTPLRIALAALVVALLAGGGYAALRARHAAAAAPAAPALDPNRIAVLYFHDQSGTDSLQYLADGLTDALIHELSQVKVLRVISRNGVAPYRKADVAPDSIARALKVGTIVSGTVAQSAGRLRVNVALVNPATGEEIGSKTIERPRAELFALQDELSRDVSQFLRQRLGREVAALESRAGTRDVAAWELVQQAQHLTDAADSLAGAGDSAATEDRLRRADSLLARAQSADESWITPVVARGWLAYKHTRLSGAIERTYYDTWFTRGLDFAQRALTMQPKDADALELRGTLRYWRWILNLAPGAEAAKLFSDAEADFRASVAANPAQAGAWNALSHLLMAKSETAEGKLAALRAYEADPYLTNANATVWRLFQASLDLEDGPEANRWCQEGQRRFPGDARFAACQLWLFALKDTRPDIPKAWKLADEYVQLSPADLKPYRKLEGGMLVAIALARAGLADSARAVAIHSRGDATVDQTRDLLYIEAIARNILGDRDDTIRLLQTWVATNPQRQESIAKDQSWYFRNLVNDPRYKALAGGS